MVSSTHRYLQKICLSRLLIYVNLLTTVVSITITFVIRHSIAKLDVILVLLALCEGVPISISMIAVLLGFFTIAVILTVLTTTIFSGILEISVVSFLNAKSTHPLI